MLINRSLVVSTSEFRTSFSDCDPFFSGHKLDRKVLSLAMRFSFAVVRVLLFSFSRSSANPGQWVQCLGQMIQSTWSTEEKHNTRCLRNSSKSSPSHKGKWKDTEYCVATLTTEQIYEGFRFDYFVSNFLTSRFRVMFYLPLVSDSSAFHCLCFATRVS